MIWPTKNIEDLFQQPTPQIKGVPKKEYKSAGSFPIIDQGAQLIAGYSDNEKKVYRSNLPVVVFGDHTRIFKYIDFPFVPGADGTKILIPSLELNPKYFYFVLQNCELENLGYSRHFKVLKNKKISLPPLSVQKRIVGKIEKLMRKIEEAKKLRQEAIEETDQIIPSALHQILNSKLKKCTLVELVEALDYEQPTKYIVNSINYNDNYATPVLTAGKSFILGYTNEKDGVFQELPVIIFDDFTTAIKYVDFPFKVKSSAMKILHAKKNKADIKYLFYIMQTIKFESVQHKRFWISEYSKIKIPLPPLSEQKKIVVYLDSLSEKVEKLKNYQLQTAADLDALTQSILRQAFEGKLTTS